VPGRVILETERLLLREFDEADAEATLRLGSDPAVMRYTHEPMLTDVEQARAILRDHPIGDYGTHGFGRWACVLKVNDELIGFAGLKRLEDLAGEVDVGYRFLPAYWGRGLATEAGRAAMDYGFNRLRLQRIIGLVDPENVASVRVLQKLGLTFETLIDYRGMRVARYAIQASRAAENATR
jgi:RimJ/RimL family protein N-acetyltransferase